MPRLGNGEHGERGTIPYHVRQSVRLRSDVLSFVGSVERNLRVPVVIQGMSCVGNYTGVAHRLR